jgi:tetrapyrrole methylase family protein/MazG family protein
MPALTLFLETCNALGIESPRSLTLADVDNLAHRHVPGFAPDAPAVLAVIETQSRLEMARRVLMTVYPAHHPVKLVRLSADSAQVLDSTLAGMSGEGWTALYLPALAVGTSFEAFQEIIAHLRAPDGCPWDKEQTHLTLRKHLLEESYETLAAMDEQDPAKMREEFGDLLLQIVLNAQIGSEFGEYTMTEVLKGIYDKIIRRHPHVFGEVEVNGVGDVLSNWEKIKAGEREKAGKEEKGLLDGLPAALPALTQAQEFQDRAARVGFDWPEIEGVLEKVREEIEEVRQSQSPEEFASELGDLFFALVNLSRWKKVDAEAALREASLKFKKRFGYVEKRARAMGRSMKEMSIEELDVLWLEAKRQTSI